MPVTRQHVTHSRALAGAVLLLLVLTFLPARYGYWANRLQAVPALAIGPSQWLFRSIGGLFSRPGRRADEVQLHALEMDRDQWRSQYLAERERRREAEERLAVVEAGARTPDEAGISVRRAQVIGPAGAPGTQMLRLRAGTGDGVTRGTVAVVDRVQVVGRVEDIRAGTCTLVLITQVGRPPVPIQGTLLFSEAAGAPDDSVLCQLSAFGDGTLRGMVEHKPARPGGPPHTAKEGQTVYLNDRAWPENSRMLVLGRVVKVGAFKDDPLRQLITVEPTVRPDRVAEVWLRIPGAESGAPGGGGG